MAKDVTIGGSGALFVGEDKVFRLELLDTAGLPVDMAGWVVKMGVRTQDGASDPPLFDKTATIDGTFSATRALNTQRATVVLTDTEMLTVAARTYRHAWKRMTEGNETILAYGPFIVQQPAVW